MFAALLAGCSTNIIDIEEDGATHMLSLRTSTEKGEIKYPLNIYAYSGDELVGETSVNSSSDNISLNLPTGVYDVYAVSGSRDFSNGGYITEPLMIGKNNVTLGKADAETTVTMKYAVARLNVALSDVPESITDVKVGIGSLRNSIGNNGELSGSTTITLQCHKKDDLWLSDTVYVLPSVGDNVTLAITQGMDNSSGMTTFSYDYPYPIQAGYPYNFKGSYTSGVTMSKLSLAVDMEGWGEDIEPSFAFGEGAGKDGNVTPTSVSVFTVKEMPTVCSVWNGHVVATIDETTGEALLLSLEEWEGVSSNDEDAEDPTQSSRIASEYVEKELMGWNVPTYEELRGIRNVMFNIEKLNEEILELEGVRLEAVNVKKYYVCSSNMLNWGTGMPITSENKGYLRLVKPVKFVLNQ